MCVLSLLISVIVFVLLKIFPEKIRNTTGRSTVLLIIGWCVGIAGLAGFLMQGFHTINIALDLSEESYITYTGDFRWSEQEGKSAMDMAVLADDEITVSALWDTHPLHTGDYTGKIVYSRRSKIVVEIDTISQ